MGIFDRFLYIRVVSAEPEQLLTRLLQADVELLDIQFTDILTTEIKVRNYQLPKVRRISERCGAACTVLKKEGLAWRALSLFRRPVLAAGLLVFGGLAVLLPGRIFFVQVAGNQDLSEQLILNYAEESGICFGTKAAAVRSEEVKNRLLSRLPQLQWLGITTEGTVATIRVRERSLQEPQPDAGNRVSSIIAARDGVLTSQTVYRGNPLFQPGDTVRAGDVLVSAYTDCGLKVKAELAQGEIFAYTLRNHQFVSIAPVSYRGEFTGEHTCYRLRIGKKVINFCNHSGIPDPTCVKMYSEDFWSLPGGFLLPVSTIQVKHLYYRTAEAEQEEDLYLWLPEYAREYLRMQMIAGEILEEKLQWDPTDAGMTLTGNYACHEMIGQVRYEENIEHNAENN